MRDPDDESALLALIHDAIGDPERWQRLEARMQVRPLRPEIRRCLAAALAAHHEATGIVQDIARLQAIHDRLPVGVIVCSAERAPLSANVAGRRYLHEGRGLAVVEGCLFATDPSARAAWDHAWQDITELCTDSTCDREPRLVPLLCAGADSISGLALRSGPTTQGVLDTSVVTLLLLGPNARLAASPDILGRVFGFTARQSQLASLLACGCALEDAARSLGITIATAKTFLAQLMARTESSTRAELLLRLLAVPHTEDKG